MSQGSSTIPFFFVYCGICIDKFLLKMVAVWYIFILLLILSEGMEPCTQWWSFKLLSNTKVMITKRNNGDWNKNCFKLNNAPCVVANLQKYFPFQFSPRMSIIFHKSSIMHEGLLVLSIYGSWRLQRTIGGENGVQNCHCLVPWLREKTTSPAPWNALFLQCSIIIINSQ